MSINFGAFYLFHYFDFKDFVQYLGGGVFFVVAIFVLLFLFREKGDLIKEKGVI